MKKLKNFVWFEIDPILLPDYNFSWGGDVIKTNKNFILYSYSNRQIRYTNGDKSQIFLKKMWQTFPKLPYRNFDSMHFLRNY